MSPLIVVSYAIALGLGCSSQPKPADEKTTPQASDGLSEESPAVETNDMCSRVADHFESWRRNPDWSEEISPREELLADCRTDHWSQPLIECLLQANSPLDLDRCTDLSMTNAIDCDPRWTGQERPVVGIKDIAS